MSKNAPTGIQRLLLAGVAAAGCFYLAPAALAQQAYYLPQAAGSSVTVNYGALSPFGVAASPAVPGGFQPYGYAQPSRLSSKPKSVFTPYGAQAPVTGYAAPAYGYAPTGYAAAPTVAPFVAPYANPAFAPGYAANRTGLPVSTPTSGGYPQSYLNAPGAQKTADVAPTKKKKKKKKSAAPAEMPASTPTATEEAAAAKVAAAEAVLESTPATPAPDAAAAAAPEPSPTPPPPTPPAEPEAVPASVPSPAQNAPAATASIAATEQPAASNETATAPAEQPAAEQPAAEAPAEQTASAEAPAETAPSTGATAALPAGGVRIVFEPGNDDLPQGATGELDALAEKMASDQNLKVQVLAYSSGTPDAESQARRKSLARGLEVRKYLIGKGVRSNRIDVRALGTKSDGDPADRVDIVPSAG